jgi:hypothetical protein
LALVDADKKRHKRSVAGCSDDFMCMRGSGQQITPEGDSKLRQGPKCKEKAERIENMGDGVPIKELFEISEVAFPTAALIWRSRLHLTRIVPQ